LTIELIVENDSGIINFDLKSRINQIFIPFSDISSQKIEEYIYSGGEKIPFRERHPIFQTLMLVEFEEC
jgi:hypothetical protein